MISKMPRGFSLIEMLIATAILLVAVGVLTELAAVGRQHSRGAEEAATAHRICQNVMAEILCGSMALQSVADVAATDDQDWTYSVEIRPLEQFQWEPQLAELRVTASKSIEGAKQGKSFSVARWIRYPSGKKTEEPSRQEEERPPRASPGRGPLMGGPPQ